MAVERIIGIDFGTSTSVIRVKRYENGKPVGEKLRTEVFKFTGDTTTIPTLIRKKADNHAVVYYGNDAKTYKSGDIIYRDFKIDLENSNLEMRNIAQKLAEEFFCYLAKEYRKNREGGYLGELDDKERTVVSYPVKWSAETRRFMVEAAQKAGFPNVTGMDEAQAAIGAVTVMNEDFLRKNNLLVNDVPSNILLIDMGAGTTDLVLCRYTPGSDSITEIVSTWPKSGEILFGGREVDDLLKVFFRNNKVIEPQSVLEQALRKIDIQQFKAWKEETVSPALERKHEVRDFSPLDTYLDVLQQYDNSVSVNEYSLNRTSFENSLAAYLEKFPKLINGCLQDAGMDGSEVDLVIVTGGHSQWYFVKDMLAGKMQQFGELLLPKIMENPARIIRIFRPQETVALGLVYSSTKPKLVQEDDTFFMPIEDVFPIPGRGIAVTGKINKGKIRIGQKIAIVGGRYKIIYASVEAIEMYHKLLDSALGGDDVGLLLSVDVHDSDVKPGQVIVAPRSKYEFTDSFVACFALRKEKDVIMLGSNPQPRWAEMIHWQLTSRLGRLKLSAGNEVSIVVNNTMIPAQVSIMEQTGDPRRYDPMEKYIIPGTEMLAEIHIHVPTILFPGNVFGIVYKGCLVGDGVIKRLQNVFLPR